MDWEHFLHGGDVQKAGDCAIIDAVFGVGLSRDVEGTYAEVLDWINKAETEWVLAVDMPSGIHSDTGAVMGTAVKADVTVTFGYEKMGSALYPVEVIVVRLRYATLDFRSSAGKKLEQSNSPMIRRI